MNQNNPAAQIAFNFGGWTVNPPGSISNDPGTAVEGLITGGISLLLIVSILLCFFFVVTGGIQFIMSSGDKAAVQRGRDQVTWALMGLGITFLALLAVKAVGDMLGIVFF